MSIPKCEICDDDFSSEAGDHSPRNLKCSHTSCERCTKNLLNNGRIVCPFCREPTEIPGNTIKSLHKNFSLIQMIQTKTTDVEKSSENCPPKCKEHPSNLAEFVCIEDYCPLKNKLICRICEHTGNHKGHTKELLTSRAAELRRILKRRVMHIQSNILKYKSETSVIEGAEKINEQLLNMKLKEIKDHFDRIRQSTGEKEKQLTDELTARATKIREMDNTTKANLLLWQQQLSGNSEETEKRIDMNDFDLYTAGIGEDTWFCWSSTKKHPPTDTVGMDVKLPTIKFEDGN
ncbi:RING-type domain-containing protein [Caenorhabditis elegans]|uniref:RING-type domain-containing protein n=1 Tax=Caenorhabditis elegans TaxID=6239 RepID=F0IWS6_CAEEL|nr:RING-type domain-containing protein [Caenorhabditis elegans]CCD61650.1 RING-type domain-containing protein [Caenorhabditis elegans]|eukprot:NP_494237.2 Uncharacterized protein CELE_ZK1240.5 [Caenorhabditis elegans]